MQPEPMSTSHTPPGAPPPPAARSSSTGIDRLLIGCSLGCGCLVLVALVLAALGGLWLFTPGEQSSTVAIATADSTSVRMGDLAEDEGALQMLDHLAVAITEAQNRDQREQLPEEWGWLADLENQQKGSVRGLTMFLPREATVRVEPPGPDGGERWVAAMNPRSFVRPLRMLIESSVESAVRSSSGGETGPERAVTVGGHEALRTADGTFIVFVGGTLVAGSDLELVDDAIERLASGSIPMLETRPPEGDWDVLGRLQGTQATALLPPLGTELVGGETLRLDRLDPDALRLDVGLDIADADTLIVGGRLVCGAPCCPAPDACPLADALREGYVDLARRLEADTGVQLSTAISPRGDDLLIEAEMRGLAEALAAKTTPPD